MVGKGADPQPRPRTRSLLSPRRRAEHLAPRAPLGVRWPRGAGILLLIPVLQTGASELSDLTQVYADRKRHSC